MKRTGFLLRFKMLASYHVKDSQIGMEVIILPSCLKQERKEGFRSLGFWFMDSQSKDRLAAEFFLETFTFILFNSALKAKQYNML